MKTLLSNEELAAVLPGTVFFFDVECYSNFFYIAFKCSKNGGYVTFELSPDHQIERNKLIWMLKRFCLVGFNSNNYDIPMIQIALSGLSCKDLKIASDYIIKSGPNYGTKKVTKFNIEKNYNVKIENYNHIDIFNVCPVNGGVTANPSSLKLYAGRLHAPRMQDLPFHEAAALTAEEAAVVRLYCMNDLDNTELLFNELAPEIKLRADMSERYGVDLRSKSDAQIAEAVICSELEKILGRRPKRPEMQEDITLKYTVPDFISYKTDKLNEVLCKVAAARFHLDALGSPIMPLELDGLKVKIGESVYALGMGGLHSTEKSITHKATEDIILSDNDVESFYPRIILNQRLCPPHLGEAFLQVYETIVKTRVQAKADAAKAKKAGDKEAVRLNKTIADSLKITINGSFGKLGNKYSALYAPELMLQVTLTGQLVLLMMIEMLELAGIAVVSGNTDGVILKYHKNRHEDVRAIIAEWERRTSFKTEETRYTAVYSRDVNSYVAVKAEGGDESARFLDERLGVKTKGVFCERGSSLNSILSKNPEALICGDAVISYLKNRTPLEKTITECKDIRRFVMVKNVRGGGQKDGKYLGKVVRWYYPQREKGFISYVNGGNKVPKTDGARPLMDLPSDFPNDIDYQWYIEEAISMLYDCGALQRSKVESLFG